MTPAFEFRGISYHRDGKPMLQNASFALYQATATALIGPNGVGKTTLLQLASGILHPQRGSICIAGESITSMPARVLARQLALVPQFLEVPFDFTVQQVVEQGRTPYLGWFGRFTQQDTAAVTSALERTASTHLRHRIFNQLSGGERQRVKIALALAQQPRLLLLDEPTQNLDIGRQAELLHLLAQLRDSGLTILAALHDLHLVHGYFASVLLLSEGGLLEQGTPENMLTPERVRTAFRYSGIPPLPT